MPRWRPWNRPERPEQIVSGQAARSKPVPLLPHRSALGQRLLFRTEGRRLRLPAGGTLFQNGGRAAGPASAPFTKMAAAGFRHEPPESPSKRTSGGGRRPRVDAACGEGGAAGRRAGRGGLRGLRPCGESGACGAAPVTSRAPARRGITLPEPGNRVCRAGGGAVQALAARQPGEGAWDGVPRADAPRPPPRGKATCFPGPEGRARNGNSWREFNAGVLKCACCVRFGGQGARERESGGGA